MAHLDVAVDVLAVVVAREVVVRPLAGELHLVFVEIPDPDLGVLLRAWSTAESPRIAVGGALCRIIVLTPFPTFLLLKLLLASDTKSLRH